MELDDLKYIIRDRLVGQSAKSLADIEMILRSKTDSVLYKLRRSMYFEVGSCILVILAFGYISLATRWHTLQLYFGVFAFVFVAFMGIFLFMIKTTNNAITSSLPLKQNLTQIIQIIQTFINRYFQFTMLLLPVCLLFSFWLGYTKPADTSIPAANAFINLFSARWQLYLFVVLYVIGLGVGLYYFTRWYLNKLYGKYLEKLKGYLAELDERY